MQLFIIDFDKHENKIVINNKEMAHQMKKVLRMNSGDLFFVQTTSTNDQKEITRYQASIDMIQSNTVTGIITKTEVYNAQNYKKNKTTMAIAMPNKRAKAEMITQKLSELGINSIYFWPSERSVIKKQNDKKIDRLIKISKEATEQSRGRTIPTVKFIKEINTTTQDKNTRTIVFDKSNKDQENNNITKITKQNNILGIVGPEGGLTSNDYKKIGDKYTTKQLGDTILRTETASILAGREIKKLD